MIETAALATSVVTAFLVPLVKKGAEKLTDELSEKAGSAAADGLVGVARKLWERIRGKTRGTPDAEVVDLFEKQPDRLADPLRAVVEELLTEDAELRDEVTALLEAEEGGRTRWQLMGEYVGAVDARGATITGGQVAGVIVGSADPPSPSGPGTP
ncbi:hypothetical protein [Nocardioides caldifontis]|uniref:hypothetical protein n=1 Tax=Nocardioides caldifontis TaxID=2588938 RepID=UPI0011DFADD3|nr:hypothetical protein [Nocardioides caldifontis]